eukprot:scaffold304971_cov37-Tisochrysis_lutea.AAC.1
MALSVIGRTPTWAHASPRRTNARASPCAFAAGCLLILCHGVPHSGRHSQLFRSKHIRARPPLCICTSLWARRFAGILDVEDFTKRPYQCANFHIDGTRVGLSLCVLLTCLRNVFVHQARHA